MTTDINAITSAFNFDLPLLRENKPSDIEILVEQVFQRYSPSTVKAYKADLQLWWEVCHRTVHESTERDVLKYISYLDNCGYENTTINRKIASLSKIFSVYIALGIVQKNPVHLLATTTKIYRSVNPEIRIMITKHDVEAVIEKSTPRTSVIVKTLANTGLRISELINIKNEDIEAFDKDFMRIRIIGKGKKQRFIFISYELYQEIKKYFDYDSIFLFSSKTGKPLSRINLYKQIHKSFHKHTGKANITCHTLRHFFATQKIVHEKKDYKAISKYLGHSSVSTTLNLYTHSQLSPQETIII